MPHNASRRPSGQIRLSKVSEGPCKTLASLQGSISSKDKHGHVDAKGLPCKGLWAKNDLTTSQFWSNCHDCEGE